MSRRSTLAFAVGVVLVAGVLIALGGGPRDTRHWPAGLAEMHVVVGSVLGAAFFVIPLTIAWIMRRHERPLDRRFGLLAAFLVALGVAQFLHLATFWLPVFWLEIAVKSLAALFAVGLVMTIMEALPRELARPSQKQWRDTTEKLRAEVDTRCATEARLREAGEMLEARLSERTVELATANDMLIRQSEWLQVILSSINDAVIATDTHRRVVFLNPVAERLTHTRDVEARGQPIERLWRVHDADSGEARASLVEQAIAGGETQHAPATRVRPGIDAAPLVIEQTAVPLKGEDGALRGVALFVRDLTSAQEAEITRQRLQTGLASTNALLDTLFEGAPIGLGFWDREQRYVRINSALARMNGLPVEAHLGRTVSEVLPDIAPHFAQHFNRVLAEGRAVRDIELIGETPAAPGQKRWWRASYYPVHAGEQLIGVGATVAEITRFKDVDRERAQLLASERAARETAERANTLKDEFLATVSHELRNPLNSIVGWTHMLESGRLSEADQRKAVTTIARNARTQVRLIEDLLDFSRLGSGRLRLDVRQIDPGRVMAAACESFRAAAEVRRVALECHNDAAGVLVAADADRLQQIVSNLVSNGLKFTEAGGHVTVSMARAGSQLEIAVQDDGAGIEPQFLPHVFEPFAQAEGAGVRRHQGLGLGLSIVKSLVALHGGTISVTSDGAGRGSRFAVHLPVAAIVESGSPEERAAAARLSLRGVTVLVVDDAADARNLVQAALQEHGAEVVLADSAAAAMTALDGGHIDVLVADIGMPYEDGYALIHNVRHHARHHDLPALALTAHGSDDDRQRIAAAGFQGYQIKPAPLPALVREIRALAQRS